MPTMTTRDGVTLHLTDSGEPADAAGPPLLLLHGWGQTRAMFRHQVEGLSGSRRVVTLDFRGHGESDKPHHGYRIARLATDVVELLDHLGLERVDALGWSMGASVLWSVVDLHGTAPFRRLVCLDQPAAVAGVPWLTEAEKAESGAIFDVAGLLDLGAAIAGDDGATATTAFVRSMFSGEPEEAVWSFVQEQITATPAYAGVPLLFDHCAQDWRDVLPRIDVPTLVIGADGSHVDPSSQRYIADHVQDGRLHVFGTDVANSHFPFLENPQAFNAVVGAFLDEAVPAAG